MAKDRYGCAAHTKSGACGNGATISRASVERQVLGALQGRMLSPELVALSLRPTRPKWLEIAFSRTGRRQAAGGRRQAAGGRHELEDVNRRLMTVVDAIERGGWSLAV